MVPTAVLRYARVMGDEKRERHSEDWFGDSRDHWWNRDFLALITRRWDLAECQRVLDVGCGVGHWGRALMPHLPLTTTLIGIDREPDWVAEATTRARVFGLEGRATYQQATVEALPFEDASFDLVTCQTVLMHLPDPRAGLAEMLRVLAPGGRILCAEPNNLAAAVARFDLGDQARPLDELLALFELELRALVGKRVVGDGDSTIGEHVPGLLAALGVVDIDVYTSDKAAPFVPPYASDDERARIDGWRDIVERRLWIAPKDKCRTYYLAGGGDEASFEARWELIMDEHARTYAALQAGTYSTAGGAPFYLVSGRKPA